MKVIMLYGGKSGEHEVSLRSAASIARAFDLSRHELTLVGIDKAGAFWLQDDGVLAACLSGDAPLGLDRAPERRVVVSPSDGFHAGSGKIAADIVFPVLHGTFGEDGTIQSLVEIAGLPCVGAGVLGSAIGMDKEVTKTLWKAAGLPVVPWISVSKREFLDQAGREGVKARVGREFGFPAFVKPACAGSSVGASKARDAAELERALATALEFDVKALVEPFVPAREIECSVTGNAAPVAYVPGEIVPNHEFYDYEAKYVDPNGAALRIPADIDHDTAERVKDIAVRAFRAAELSGYARVDFFLDKRDGSVKLNEVNTIPGFTSISMFPKMCEAGGLRFTALIELLLDLAVEISDERKGIRYSL